MTHPTDPVAAMRAECANAVRRRASSLHLSKQHNAALEAAKCADLIETLPLPAAPAHDAVGCEKCRDTGIHILADLPGEGRIGGGRCPNGCPLNLTAPDAVRAAKERVVEAARDVIAQCTYSVHPDGNELVVPYNIGEFNRAMLVLRGLVALVPQHEEPAT